MSSVSFSMKSADDIILHTKDPKNSTRKCLEMVKNFSIVARKILKKRLENGKYPHAHGLVEPILWKWLFYQRKFKESMQSQAKASQNSFQK